MFYFNNLLVLTNVKPRRHFSNPNHDEQHMKFRSGVRPHLQCKMGVETDERAEGGVGGGTQRVNLRTWAINMLWI